MGKSKNIADIKKIKRLLFLSDAIEELKAGIDEYLESLKRPDRVMIDQENYEERFISKTVIFVSDKQFKIGVKFETFVKIFIQEKQRGKKEENKEENSPKSG